MRAVEQAQTRNRKRAVVVAGGPGSGKSVIALSMMGELSRRGRPVLHATGSRSFTQTLRRYAGKRLDPLQNMFMYFNSFMTAEPNDSMCSSVTRRTGSGRRRSTATPRDTAGPARPQVEELSLRRGCRCSCSMSTRL